ncbi:abscisic acid receptor pyl6 [Phtheirospermum japonicum]|uniref:Abscisic acid receptor pyl6 n=1 Tax=Phtheirospermum japonicum TaxID=374723 RepID=A0A830BYP7_9LAMI|nr:abscisic acid receptor pyl6 [Phtheirospermum japonicum]
MKVLYHTHPLLPNQCGSLVTHVINAPLPLVWSLVKKFENPKAYKQFVRRCELISGENGSAGSMRKLWVMSGLPAEWSMERLDRLDNDLHLMKISIVGGDHKLMNYRSTVTLHEDPAEGGNRTVAMESYVVDIPADSCEEHSLYFVNSIIGWNLKNLGRMVVKMERGEGIE